MNPKIKKCGNCKIEKSIKDFPKNHIFPGGLDPICKKCSNAFMRKEKDRIYQMRKRQELWKLKDKPCTDCKQRFHPWVMEWDHVRGEKELTLSCVSVSEERRDKELEKTELVCSNCHAHRTYLRNNADRTECGDQFMLACVFNIDCFVEEIPLNICTEDIEPQPDPLPLVQLDLFSDAISA